MGCQCQLGVRTLVERYYPFGTLIGTNCKHSSHLNSGLQTESSWLKDHPGLYSAIAIRSLEPRLHEIFLGHAGQFVQHTLGCTPDILRSCWTFCELEYKAFVFSNVWPVDIAMLDICLILATLAKLSSILRLQGWTFLKYAGHVQHD